MSRHPPIKEGDRVRVCFAPMNWSLDDFDAIVLHLPDATGDAIYVECEDGTVYSLNPLCTIFVGLVLLTTVEELQRLVGSEGET